MTTTDNKAEWTPDDHLASRNLKRIWLRKTPQLHLTQNKLSKQWGIAQGSISRYINGKLMLNPEAILRFSVALDVPPEHIDPRMTTLMRSTKPQHIYTVQIKTNDYEPRIFQGDTITLDVIKRPTSGQLSAAHSYNDLIIGYYTADGLLQHPTTQLLQPVPDNYLLQPIIGITPKGL